MQFEGSLNSGAVPPPGTTPPIGGVPTGNARYDLVIEPSGSDGPELHAKLEQRPDRVDFSVELEDVAVGSYDLQIGGSSRGSVTVVNVTGGTEANLSSAIPWNLASCCSILIHVANRFARSAPLAPC